MCPAWRTRPDVGDVRLHGVACTQGAKPWGHHHWASEAARTDTILRNRHLICGHRDRSASESAGTAEGRGAPRISVTASPKGAAGRCECRPLALFTSVTAQSGSEFPGCPVQAAVQPHGPCFGKVYRESTQTHFKR